MLAKAVVQVRNIFRMYLPFREQARSHRVFTALPHFPFPRQNAAHDSNHDTARLLPRADSSLAIA